MAKAAHILVSVLFSVSALGLWLMLTTAEWAIAWYAKGRSLNELALLCLHIRHYLLLIPVGAAVWTVLLYRRPSISMESAFLYFLCAAIVTVGLFVLAGACMITTQLIEF